MGPRHALAAVAVGLVLAVGLTTPVGAQDDPSGTYEGTFTYDQQRGPQRPDDGTPRIEDDLPPEGRTTTTDGTATLDCSGTSCTVSIAGTSGASGSSPCWSNSSGA